MKLLVVGCGSIGARHAANAAKAAAAAVTDIDFVLAGRVARDVGIASFATLAEALAWQPDGVIVATPHESHLEVAAAAIDAGAHVLIEKPIAHEATGIDLLLGRARLAGRRVLVVSNMRFHPAIACMRTHLPRIGRPLYARAHYGHYLPQMRLGADYRRLYCASKARGGGVIRDAVHEIDYLSWLLGPIEDVVCAAGKLSDLDIDVEDYAILATTHTNGARSEIHFDYLQRFKRRGCEIVGTEATLLWESEGRNPEDCRVRLLQAGETGAATLLHQPSVDPNDMYHQLISAFISAIEGHETVLASGAEGARTLAVALGALASAARDGVQLSVARA